MSKKIIVLAIGVGTLLLGWLAYSKIAQSRRETAYRVAIAPYQRDLHTGMSRADVEKYLDSRKVEHSWMSFGRAESYAMLIGEEPGGLVCKSWKVYISLDFDLADRPGENGTRIELDPADRLREIRIRKLGTCL